MRIDMVEKICVALKNICRHLGALACVRTHDIYTLHDDTANDTASDHF